MNFHMGDWSESIEINEQGLANEFEVNEVYKVIGQTSVDNKHLKIIKNTDRAGYVIVNEEELKALIEDTEKLDMINQLECQLYYVQKKLDWLSGRTKEANKMRTLQKKNRMEICHRYKEEGLSAQEIADKAGIGLSSVYRLLKQYEREGKEHGNS